jgi:hypothetical protein
VASRLVGLVGLVDVLWRDFHQSPSRRPEQRYQLQRPFRVHLCGGGCDRSARWLVKRLAGCRSRLTCISDFLFAPASSESSCALRVSLEISLESPPLHMLRLPPEWH